MKLIDELEDLILVAGHAAFRGNVSGVPAQPESDEFWVLDEGFQLGEPAFYIEHIRRGVVLAANNPDAMLMFSGGLTRRDAGTWSEARTYHELAEHYLPFWVPDRYNKNQLREDIAKRMQEEGHARDSYENLLFGICRFLRLTGHTPRLVTVVSWAFKATRFQMHRAAIGFPAARFRFDGFNEPVFVEGAWRGELKTLRDFVEHPHGTASALFRKRMLRTFGPRDHDYRKCNGLHDFIELLESGREIDEIEFPSEVW